MRSEHTLPQLAPSCQAQIQYSLLKCHRGPHALRARANYRLHLARQTFNSPVSLTPQPQFIFHSDLRSCTNLVGAGKVRGHPWALTSALTLLCSKKSSIASRWKVKYGVLTKQLSCLPALLGLALLTRLLFVRASLNCYIKSVPPWGGISMVCSFQTSDHLCFLSSIGFILLIPFYISSATLALSGLALLFLGLSFEEK